MRRIGDHVFGRSTPAAPPVLPVTGALGVLSAVGCVVDDAMER
ncbi:hypothetical protein [Streptomyces sp. NPDC057545]